jgi:RimJ/RimL family protein N-acetyltransferase
MKMIYGLSPQTFESIHKFEAISEEQVAELAVVMLDSLKNTCEDKGETLQDIISELVEVMDGSFAPFISDASYQIRQNGEIASSIMISYYEGYPLISEIFTNKKYQGLGMAKALIKKSINTLMGMGYTKLVLNVEVENIVALNLYKKIGFEKEEINVHKIK